MDNVRSSCTAPWRFSQPGYDASASRNVDPPASPSPPLPLLINKRGLLNCLLETHFNELFVGFIPGSRLPRRPDLTLEKITRGYFTYAEKTRLLPHAAFALFRSPDSEPNQAWLISTWNSTRRSRKFFLWLLPSMAICAAASVNTPHVYGMITPTLPVLERLRRAERWPGLPVRPPIYARYF